jgi:hypothetical protein
VEVSISVKEGYVVTAGSGSDVMSGVTTGSVGAAVPTCPSSPGSPVILSPVSSEEFAVLLLPVLFSSAFSELPHALKTKIQVNIIAIILQYFFFIYVTLPESCFLVTGKVL